MIVLAPCPVGLTATDGTGFPYTWKTNKQKIKLKPINFIKRSGVGVGGEGICFPENILRRLWPFTISLPAPPHRHRPPSGWAPFLRVATKAYITWLFTWIKTLTIGDRCICPVKNFSTDVCCAFETFRSPLSSLQGRASSRKKWKTRELF